jgi:hypothetical protein
MRPLTQAESARLAAVAERTRRKLDETAGLLLLAVARGDGSALPELSDRLEEIGRPGQAAQIRAAAADLEEKRPAKGDKYANRLADEWVSRNRDAVRAMARERALDAYWRPGADPAREQRAAPALALLLRTAFEADLCSRSSEFHPAAVSRLDWLARARRLIAEAAAGPGCFDLE